MSSVSIFSSKNYLRKSGLAINNTPNKPMKAQIISLLDIFSPKTRNPKKTVNIGIIDSNVITSDIGINVLARK